MVNSPALCALPGALTELKNSGVEIEQWAIDAFELEIPAESRFEYAASLGLADLTRAYHTACVDVDTVERVMASAAGKVSAKPCLKRAIAVIKSGSWSIFESACAHADFHRCAHK